MDTATIMFIGLCLFTSAKDVVVSPERLRVVLPRVDATTNPALDVHQAVILFRDADATSSDWPRVDYAPDTTYDYVELKGETITINGAPNDVAIASGFQLPNIPRMTSCCSSMTKGTMPPDSTKAAAVFKLAQGVPSTCVSELVKEKRRVDTTLAVKTAGGPLTIVGTNAAGVRKQLVLRGDARVFVANLPAETIRTGVFTEHTHTDTTAAHYQAYYKLLRHGSSCKLTSRSLQITNPPPAACEKSNWGGIWVTTTDEFLVGGMASASSSPHHGGGGGGKTIVTIDETGTGSATDSECSNTQWP